MTQFSLKQSENSFKVQRPIFTIHTPPTAEQLLAVRSQSLIIASKPVETTT